MILTCYRAVDNQMLQGGCSLSGYEETGVKLDEQGMAIPHITVVACALYRLEPRLCGREAMPDLVGR